MPDRKINPAYIYGGMAVLLWSTVSTAFKLSLRHLTPLGLLLFSSLSASVFLAVYLWASGGIGSSRCVLRELRDSIPAGALNPFIYYLMLFNAYDRLPAQQAQVLNYTWAIVLPLMSLAVLKEKLRGLDLIALVISFLGVVVISTRGDLATLRFEDPVGVLIAVSTSLVWASYWIINMKDRRPAAVKLCFNFVSGTLMILAWSLVSRLWSSPEWFVKGASVPLGLAGGLYVGLFEMGLTFLIWYKALEKASSTASVSNLIFITPFLSLGFIAFLLRERIYPATILGLVIIIVSNAVQKAGHRRSAKVNRP